MNTRPHITCRKLGISELDYLHQYLLRLGEETRRRFEPHPFDIDGIKQFYAYNEALTAYIAEDILQNEIIAYALIKQGMLQHDRERLMQYGQFDPGNGDGYCTFAPSVADNWQHKGIGSMLFTHIVTDLKNKEITKIILWGGVQEGNAAAVNFYKKAGFRTLGSFEYNGSSLDMMLDII